MGSRKRQKTPAERVQGRQLPERPNEVTVERLENAVLIMARIVVLHGPVYAPLLFRLERELMALRRDDPVARAKRILELHRTTGRVIVGDAESIKGKE